MSCNLLNFKKVSTCDSYVDLMELTGCDDIRFYKHSLSICFNFYRTQDPQEVQYNNVFQCADQCLRDQIRSAFEANKTSCEALQVT